MGSGPRGSGCLDRKVGGSVHSPGAEAQHTRGEGRLLGHVSYHWPWGQSCCRHTA